MGVSSSQAAEPCTSESQLPRRVYFGAADKQHLSAKQIAGGDLHALEVGRRQKLAQTLIQRAEDVAGAVKTLRSFDATGNTENAIDHLQATLEDLTLAHRIFVDDVTGAIGRYRDRRENHAIIAGAAARLNAANPGLGAGPVSALAVADADAHEVAIGEGRISAAELVEAAEKPIGYLANIVLNRYPAPKPGPRA